MDQLVLEYNLGIKKYRINKKNNVSKQLSEKLISSFYKLENLNSPEFLTVDKKYYLAEMTESKTLKKIKMKKK